MSKTARKAGRPPKGTAAPGPEALVAAAYAQLAEHGFEGLRTRDVATAAGVNVATLHYHFPTKEALIAAVVGRALSRFRTTLPSHGSPARQLSAHFQGLRILARKEPELFVIMGELSQRAARDQAVARMLEKTDRYWTRTLQDLLRGARVDGSIARASDPVAAAALIVAALKGLYMVPATSPRRLDSTLRQLERWLGLRR